MTGRGWLPLGRYFNSLPRRRVPEEYFRVIADYFFLIAEYFRVTAESFFLIAEDF